MPRRIRGKRHFQRCQDRSTVQVGREIDPWEALKMKTILVPLDGSDLAARALPFATALAKRAGWSILLLAAVDTLSAPDEEAKPGMIHAARATLDEVAAGLTAAGITTRTRAVAQQPETAILEATADEDVTLVAMSTHGRSGIGRFIYGSVADTVFRHAPVPVLTVPPHGLDEWPADGHITIMVPLDGSEVSQSALAPAAELAEVLGGSLLLASVIPFPSYAMAAEGFMVTPSLLDESPLTETQAYLEELAAKLRTPTRQVEVCAIYGSPHFGVTTIARDRKVGAIVMATHGRGGVTRALLGSVATSTLRQSDVPVVLVRPETADQLEVDDPAT